MADEERLELADIQGAIIPGFKKDHSALIYLRIKDRAACKAWLKERAPELARADEVLKFNRLYKQMRARRGGEAQTPKVLWISMSFSMDGLSILRDAEEIQAAFSVFDPFDDGMHQSALADPAPNEWVIGGSAETVPHILLVVAADDPKHLAAEIKRLRGTIRAAKSTEGRAGLQLMKGPGLDNPQIGATLPGERRGHEHFGFKDGISQPAVRGLASDNPKDFVDRRRLAPADPNFEIFAEPGRPLVWPGQFVLGYLRQNPSSDDETRPAFPVRVPWQRNGSLLVYRRLRQKVHLFWHFCTQQAERLSAETGKQISPVAFASLLVGRWPSGAPLMRASTQDDPDLAADDNANNDFQFSNNTPLVTLADGTIAGERFPRATADPSGERCPFAAHIRKVHPRDDPSDTTGPTKTKTQLMLRRGIPYGPATATLQPADDDGEDRGLLFMAYQGSLRDQFEFVTKTWVNRDNSPHDSQPPAGSDPLIGANPDSRTIRILLDGKQAEIGLPAEPWVVMTGGGYFFTPSISALSEVLAQ